MPARLQINLSWLLKLRWAAVVGQSLTVGIVGGVLGISLPWLPLAAILTLEALTNAGLWNWFKRQDWSRADRPQPSQLRWLIASIMLVDVLLLSGLLYYTGGPLNPFSIFYIINISLAAVVLQPRLAWGLALVALACYSALFAWHVPLEPLEFAYHAQDAAPPASSLGLATSTLLLAGLWVAFTGAVTFIVYFITRVTTELARREAELSAAQRRRAESQKVEALATLAAGAAHELANPLATIAVAAHELDLALAAQQVTNHALDDVRLIRQEVDRCRGILDLMAAEAGQDAGEKRRRLSARQLIESALAGWHDAEQVDIVMAGDVETAHVVVPVHAVSQSLRAILQNAIDASPPGARVSVQARTSSAWIEYAIRDQGSGMPPEVLACATDPFFTTKEAGKGMGLGLFLVRTVVERLGGHLQLDSVPNQGTEITVRLPRAE